MKKTAKLLSEPTNFAIVQLPERKYPGCVLQGDTMNAWIETIQNALECIGEPSRDSMDDLRGILDNLKRVRAHYESVCSEAGIEVPYVRQAKTVA